jgi:hypothetical protein
MDGQSLKERLEQNLNNLRDRLRLANETRDEAALAATGGNEAAQAQLDEAEKAVADLEKQVARAEAALRSEGKRKTKQELADESAKAQTAGARAVKAANGRVALAKKIDKTFADLGALLEQWKEQGDSIAEDTYTICDFAARKAGAHVERFFDSVSQVARGSTDGCAGALTHALKAAGVGRTGVYHADLALMVRPLGEAYSFVEVAELLAERLAAHVSRLAPSAE